MNKRAPIRAAGWICKKTAMAPIWNCWRLREQTSRRMSPGRLVNPHNLQAMVPGLSCWRGREQMSCRMSLNRLRNMAKPTMDVAESAVEASASEPEILPKKGRRKLRGTSSLRMRNPWRQRYRMNHPMSLNRPGSLDHLENIIWTWSYWSAQNQASCRMRARTGSGTWRSRYGRGRKRRRGICIRAGDYPRKGAGNYGGPRSQV